jgi:AcrR family transcriptional regulator
MGSKGDTTRERLHHAAWALFAARGFEAVTMKDIADAAGRSPGLAYRYVRRKEDFVHALYAKLVDDVAARVNRAGIPDGTLAARFRTVMRWRFEAMADHRAVLVVLLGVMLDPGHPLGVFNEAGAAVRDANRALLEAAVIGATDPPPEPAAVVDALYLGHLALQLLWFQDRSEGQVAAHAALDLAHDVLAMVPADHPLLAVALHRLRQITDPLLGDT